MLLGGKDERSIYVRRMKEVVAEFVDDKGGANHLSAAEKSLIRRVAVLTIELEKLETRVAEDPTVGESTLDLYNRTAGNLGRLLERLGIKRIEKPAVTLDVYLSAKKEARA